MRKRKRKYNSISCVSMAYNNVISFQTSQEYSKKYEADFKQLPKKVCI